MTTDHSVVGRPGAQDLGVPREVAVLRTQGALRRRRVPIAHRRVDPAAVLQLARRDGDAVRLVVLAVFAAREDGAADDHDEADDEAEDRADVRLAAHVFVRSAASVLNATIQRNPVVPLALGLLREDPALAVIELFGAHVAAGLAAVVFVRSAAMVRMAIVGSNGLVGNRRILPVVKLALGLLVEEPALADFIELFAAHVAAGGGANREGDEREEVLRNKHGGGAGAALSEVEFS